MAKIHKSAAALAIMWATSAAGADAFRNRIEPVGPKETREYQTEQARLARETLEAQQATIQALAAISRQLEGISAGAAQGDASAGGVYADLERMQEQLKEIASRMDEQNGLTKELVGVMREQLRLNRSLFAFLDDDGQAGNASAPLPGMQLEVEDAPPSNNDDLPVSPPEKEPPGATWIVK